MEAAVKLNTFSSRFGYCPSLCVLSFLLSSCSTATTSSRTKWPTLGSELCPRYSYSYQLKQKHCMNLVFIGFNKRAFCIIVSVNQTSIILFKFACRWHIVALNLLQVLCWNFVALEFYNIALRILQPNCRLASRRVHGRLSEGKDSFTKQLTSWEKPLNRMRY